MLNLLSWHTSPVRKTVLTLYGGPAYALSWTIDFMRNFWIFQTKVDVHVERSMVWTSSVIVAYQDALLFSIFLFCSIQCSYNLSWHLCYPSLCFYAFSKKVSRLSGMTNIIRVRRIRFDLPHEGHFKRKWGCCCFLRCCIGLVRAICQSKKL